MKRFIIAVVAVVVALEVEPAEVVLVAEAVALELVDQFAVVPVDPDQPAAVDHFVAEVYMPLSQAFQHLQISQ